MTNYDYNKGYRGFRFKKNDNIDQKLPALKTYLETREKSSIYWITHNERVLNNSQKSLSPRKERFLNQIADNSSSVLCFPKIVSDNPYGDMLVYGCQAPDEDSMEGMLEKYSLAPINVTPASPFQKELTAVAETSMGKVGASNSIIKRKTPRDFCYGEIKSRKHYHRKKPHRQTNRSQNHEIYLRNKKLEECLVIQNGIERSWGKDVGENKLLTREKTEDIINWIGKMST